MISKKIAQFWSNEIVYTFKPEVEKSLRVILKGILEFIVIEEIQEGRGFEISSIAKIYRK